MFIASEYQLQHEAPFGAKWISLPEELNNDFSYGPINILLLWSLNAFGRSSVQSAIRAPVFAGTFNS